MVLWINGAFGAGKTVTAAELKQRVSDSYVYDPENVGFFLRKNVPEKLLHRYNDFRDDPLWLDFNFKMLYDIGTNYSGNVFVTMTLTDPEMYEKTIGRLRANGVSVAHFVIGCDRATLRRRQHSRFDYAGSWADAHADECIAALSKSPFEGYIDTTGMSIPDVAEEIAKRAGIDISQRKSKAAQLYGRFYAQIKAIRK